LVHIKYTYQNFKAIMKKIWNKVSTERVFSCPYLKVYKSRFENNLDYSDDFYSLDFGDWVHVVPVLEDNRILMIELYRFGTEKVSLEFPGGQIEKNQTAEESAKNELFEETRWIFDHLPKYQKDEPKDKEAAC
jgi:hypothetical protein